MLSLLQLFNKKGHLPPLVFRPDTAMALTGRGAGLVSRLIVVKSVGAVSGKVL